jgi:DNA anti-recombination protein RmuC
MAHREQNDGGCSSQFEDVSALLKEVQVDPQSVFNKLHSIVQENDELKGTMKSISEQLESERQHLKKTIQNFEDLQTIEKSKQVLLWKLIERFNGGGVSPHISTNEKTTRLDNTDEDAGFRLLKENRLKNLKLDPNAVCSLHP